jgi:hypothetical protein
VFSETLSGENDPVPDDAHMPPVAAEFTDPLRETFALLAHTVWSGPAFTVGASVIVNVITSVWAVHPPLLVDVNVNVKIPAAVSRELGI